MKFIKIDLGSRRTGELVEVTLRGSAANVRLMDSSNFNAYRAGRQHRYTGGLARRSPITLRIPHSGRWYVVVDMAGLRGNVKASAQVLPSALPEIRERPLAAMPSLLRDARPSDSASDELGHDVFICHASADKDEVVRELADHLRSKELRVWFDEFTLQIGDNLRRKIDSGLANSRFGVVVLSPAFFANEWPQYELDGLVTRDIEESQIILPIWHNITKEEVIQQSPPLATRLARSTATHTLEEIADEIASVVNQRTIPPV